MADLGVDGQAVRSSITRLKRRGVLLSDRRGSAAGYALAEPRLDRLAEDGVPFFHHNRATTQEARVVVVYSVPALERESVMSFGQASPAWVSAP